MLVVRRGSKGRGGSTDNLNNSPRPADCSGYFLTAPNRRAQERLALARRRSSSRGDPVVYVECQHGRPGAKDRHQIRYFCLLIGVCGHDDILQGPYRYLETDGKTRSIRCTIPDSSLYLPGSLGPEWDISEPLKKDILQAQIPGTQGYGMPAKYYHVYGAALATCQMISEGLPAALSIRIETEAARFYRGIRLCSRVNKLLGERQKEVEQFDLQNSSEVFDQWWTTTHRQKNKNLPASYFENKLADLNAAALYQRWYVGSQSVLGMKIPCTDLRLWGPSRVLPSAQEKRSLERNSEERKEGRDFLN